MSEVAILSTVLGVLGTVCAIAFGYSSYKRNNRMDNTDEGKESGTILTEIGYIKAGVDDIKRKQEKQDERHLEIISRITAVEQSTKQAHLRLDRMVNRDV
ncbi:MAG: hypothetical protein K9L62_00525 [Vallitaleaceae bacterium]|nr:hypothetical protein [Vallitaleaceae bacterium]